MATRGIWSGVVAIATDAEGTLYALDVPLCGGGVVAGGCDRWWGQAGGAPSFEGGQDVGELVASCGQRVDGSRVLTMEPLALHRSVGLEVPEPFGQRLLAHPAHAGQQVAVAQGTGFEVADDQGGPAPSDQVGGSLGWMVFGAHRVRVGTFSCLRFRLGKTGRRFPAMDAYDPQDLPLVFRHHLNAGDVAGLMDHYYAPAATYAPVPGVIVAGTDVEVAITKLAAIGQPIELDVRHVLVQDDTALIVLDWEIVGLGMRGTATDVARRQPDGRWRCIIDNPHGGITTAEIPEQTARLLAD